MSGWATTGTARGALRAAVAAGALAVALAGCGSSDDGPAASATTTGTAPVASAPPAATTTEAAPSATTTATSPAPTTTAPGAAATTPGGTTTSPRATAPVAPTRSSGSAADQAAVRQTVDRYMEAFADGDAATVCGLLNDRQRRLLGSRGLGTCEQAVERASAAVAKDGTIAKTLRSLRVDTVAVDGDRAVGAASVSAAGARQTVPVELERTADGWRISSNAPAGG